MLKKYFAFLFYSSKHSSIMERYQNKSRIFLKSVSSLFDQHISNNQILKSWRRAFKCDLPFLLIAQNEKNKSIAFLHKTFTRKLNFSFHCFSDAIFLCFSIILYLWIGIIPLFLIFQFTLLFMLPSFPRQTRNRRIYFLDTSLKVRNRK